MEGKLADPAPKRPLALTIGAAAATLLVILGVLSGPSVVSCFNSEESLGLCLRGKMADAGLIPAAPETVAETPAETAPDVAAVSEPQATPDAEIGQQPALDVTPPATTAPDVPDDLIAATFGLLRAEPDGSVVIAGSGKPGSEVEVFANGDLLGSTQVEPSGDWVFVPEKPLPPGGVEVTLGEAGKSGKAAESFVVVVNDDKTSQPLVVASTPGEASQVLQGLQTPDQATQMASAEPAAKPAAQPDAAPETASPDVAPAPGAATTAPAPGAAPAPATAADAPVPSTSTPTPAPAAPDASATPSPSQPAMSSGSETAPAATTPAPAEPAVAPAPEMQVAEAPPTPQAPAASEPSSAAPAAGQTTTTVQATSPSPAPAQPPAAPADTTVTTQAPTVTPEATAEPSPAPTTTATAEPATASAPAPTIDAVEVEGDKTYFAGAATDGRVLRLYVDDTYIADTVAAGGRWLIEAGKVLTKASQLIRIDLLEPNSSKVVSRAEVNFVVDLPVSDQPVAIADAEKAVAGETAPPSASPDAGAPASAESQTTPATKPAADQPTGSEPATPSAASGNTSGTTETPAAPPPATEATAAPSPASALENAPASTVPTMVAVSMGGPDAERFAAGKAIIRRGDNLWTIARRVYGEGIKYTTIYQANTGQIRDPDRIYPGQVFDLPGGAQ